ncbi:family 20 glycosylhydrolase [Maribacter arenosus]|uniref:beta-N-acetylhexosaminidase n=1 Tax=Maribacter arenosus TaxID=1854708 RepID=A0ABR7VEY2_9FLAO|nr:family 20 glycosylhydrolase [Maribacter arenosus]MBD0852199.1 beta-N-acetylhexosaminidase [Maribacter arenosus]
MTINSKPRRIIWFLIPFILLSLGCTKNLGNADIAARFPIIPTPKEMVYGQKELSFTSVSMDTLAFRKASRDLNSFFLRQGFVVNDDGLKITFIKDDTDDKLDNEGYSLHIDSNVLIKASTEKGAFYGVQTLKQIFRKSKDTGNFPVLDIRDWPTFKIRGFMHDTGRNFQSIAQLKEQIEVLSQYKFNVFHWHLTDDPGWRLESKIYPELQSNGAFSRQQGKFYTQEDFKDILAFCKERNITVIPEFDIPGHTAAFRKAFGIDTMKDAKVLPILLDLFDELCGLADEIEMPYIHMGTDEVRNKEEYVSNDFILKIMDRIKSHKREVIVWKEGINLAADSLSINQLWAQHPPKEDHRFIDSRANYINHLDPFAGMSRLYFQQPCRQPKGDSLALGGILCAWPDNRIENERDVLTQNPIYPSIVFYSDAIWNGREEDYKEYWAKLPPMVTPEFKAFKTFEDKVLAHRDAFFEGKEFPYVRQSDIQWKVIGPFEHKGDLSRTFPVENELKDSYKIDGRTYEWKDSIVGGTIHLKHFFGFPALTETKSGTYYAYTAIYSPDARVQDFWIGFQGWSRSGGRRGGPFPEIGQWHTTNPKIWINKKEIEPPKWKQPSLGVKTDEIPFIDEDYFYREPTKINLDKGWNRVLLKIPHGGNSWKWMFTCVPVDLTEKGVREATGLRFKTKFNVDEND